MVGTSICFYYLYFLFFAQFPEYFLCLPSTARISLFCGISAQILCDTHICMLSVTMFLFHFSFINNLLYIFAIVTRLPNRYYYTISEVVILLKLFYSTGRAGGLFTLKLQQNTVPSKSYETVLISISLGITRFAHIER